MAKLNFYNYEGKCVRCKYKYLSFDIVNSETVITYCEAMNKSENYVGSHR
jgi:hypothetical protein